ncbi:MAG: hypothetical protein QM445_04930, partial [Thermotogota bacterium]|nr:hypothetical protein [Thermotogota bacterium]
SEDGEPVTVDLRGFLRISVSFITKSYWFLLSLSSLVSAANLSAMLFLKGLCLPDEVGTGLAVGETGQAKPDWPHEVRLACVSRLAFLAFSCSQ